MDLSDTMSSISIYSDCDCYLCQFGINCQDLETNPYYASARQPLVYYAQCFGINCQDLETNPYYASGRQPLVYYAQCFGINCQDLETNPYYASGRQPLVYYAQSRHGRKRDCRECKRPNCFVRAFRWYTNEHGSPRQQGKPCQVTEPCKESCKDDCSDEKDTCPNVQNICSNEPNMSAFAVWLDSKYNQFMMENATTNAYRVQLTQTSLIETYHPDEADQPQCAPCGKKRFSRIKNHWRRKAHKCHEREYYDQERNQANDPSMEYILPPKNLSRAASECCHPSPTCSVHRHVAKSRSATATVCLNRSGYDNQEFDKPPTEQKHVKGKGKTVDHCKNASCQYVMAVENAHTQYESSCRISSNPITHPQVKKTSNNKAYPIHSQNSKTSSKTNEDNNSYDNSSSKNKKRNNFNVLCQCPPDINVQIQVLDKPSGKVRPDFQMPSQASPSLNKNASNLTDPHCSLNEPSSGLRPSEQTPQSRLETQAQNHKSSPDDVQIPCPDFQKPCPSLSGTGPNLPEPCPSLNESCLGRRPCPSLRKPCPPCPKADQQHQQAPEPKVAPDRREQAPQSKSDSPTQYTDNNPNLRDCCNASVTTQQLKGTNFVKPLPKVHETPSKQDEVSNKSCMSMQTPQAKLDSKTQYPDIKPTLRDCCTANAPTQQLQGPTFGEPLPKLRETPPKQEEFSYKSFTAVQDPQRRLDSKTQYPNVKPTLCDCCTASVVLCEQGPKVRDTPPKQEDFSVKPCAVNSGKQDQYSGPNSPNLRETSTGVDFVQGGQAYPNQNSRSLQCHCLNCYPSGITYYKSGSCKRNESVRAPVSVSHQNFMISTTGEGKCSVNCPFYAKLAIKGQTTQTVQFSQSSDSTAQTSNTAIRLDRGTIQEYPLFMRVVCADKLQ